MSLNEEGICSKESRVQSGASLGVVRDDEVLARMILSPHLVKDGVVQKGILTIEDLRERGWSFVRIIRADDSRIDDSGMRVIGEKISSQCVGYVTFEVSAARKILNSNRNQALCILDDALEDFEEHALAEESEYPSDGQIRKIRRYLMNIFSSIHS